MLDGGRASLHRVKGKVPESCRQKRAHLAVRRFASEDMVRKLATEIEHKVQYVFRLLIRVDLTLCIIFYMVALFINRELGLVDKLSSR
jgi:hypothetical protein